MPLQAARAWAMHAPPTAKMRKCKNATQKMQNHCNARNESGCMVAGGGVVLVGTIGAGRRALAMLDMLWISKIAKMRNVKCRNAKMQNYQNARYGCSGLAKGGEAVLMGSYWPTLMVRIHG